MSISFKIPSPLCMKTEKQVLKCLFPCLNESVLSESSSWAQHGLVSPHEVLTVCSGQRALHWVVSVPRSSFRTEGQAEAGCAVAHLEQAVRAEERLPLTDSQVVDCFQIVVNCDVAQLLSALRSPPSPPQEQNPCDQNQHQDS